MSPEPLVTISATYGAGGSRVGPLLAAALDVAFTERVMRRHVADRVAGPLAQANREQLPVGRSLGRILRQVAGELTPTSDHADGAADDEYRSANEREIRALVSRFGSSRAPTGRLAAPDGRRRARKYARYEPARRRASATTMRSAMHARTYESRH